MLTAGKDIDDLMSNHTCRCKAQVKSLAFFSAAFSVGVLRLHWGAGVLPGNFPVCSAKDHRVLP